MDTKLKADIAEYAVMTELLRRECRILKPIGDRLAYDIAIDLNGQLIRLQIKSAWFNIKKSMYVVDNRRTQTNRRVMKRTPYSDADFDFAILYIQEKKIFYIMPVKEFNAYASSIALVEDPKRQRPPKSARFRERWDLLNVIG